MNTEISIKAHTRKSKKGKVVNVKGYTRRVGRKGVKSPKKESSSVQPGEELTQKIIQKNIYSGPSMTDSEIAEWDRKAREMTMRNYGSRSKAMKKEEVKTSSKKTSKKKDIIERIEDKVANFVDKYSKKKYKKAF